MDYKETRRRLAELQGVPEQFVRDGDIQAAMMADEHFRLVAERDEAVAAIGMVRADALQKHGDGSVGAVLMPETVAALNAVIAKHKDKL